MAEADRLTISAGYPGIELMERAGRGVANLILRRYRRQAVLVLAGPGNNGGDGFVIAKVLQENRWPVRVALLGAPSSLKGDAALAFHSWGGEAETLSVNSLGSEELVVDALFGAGLARELSGVPLQVISSLRKRVEAGKASSVAIDMPSGIDGNSGRVRGAACPADLTVTFFRKKSGHLLHPGAEFLGDLRVIDIGISEDVLAKIGAQGAHNHPGLWRSRIPLAEAQDHKYSRGHLLTISGEMAGAALLASAAGRRAGAGISTASVRKGDEALFLGQQPGLVVKSRESVDTLRPLLQEPRLSAFILGPGMGRSDAAQALVPLVLKEAAGKSIVLDADALQPLLLEQSLEPVNAVLTPHLGEFKRLFPDIGLDDLGKLEATRRAAKKTGAVILLKGPDTVIASPDGRYCISDNGPASLATAGSGDVLAGTIGGLLAQGMPAFEAASAGAWLHGEAARLGSSALIAEDLPPLIGQVLSELR